MATALATNNGAINSLEWQLFFSSFHDRLTDLGLPYKKNASDNYCLYQPLICIVLLKLVEVFN